MADLQKHVRAPRVTILNFVALGQTVFGPTEGAEFFLDTWGPPPWDWGVADPLKHGTSPRVTVPNFGQAVSSR